MTRSTGPTRSSAMRRLGLAAVFVALFVAGAALAWATLDDGRSAAVEGAGAGAAQVLSAPPSTTSTSTTTTTTTTTVAPPRTATLAFTGDLLPHSPVLNTADANAENGWDFRPMFDEVRPILSRADLAICHLETPLSRDDSRLSGFPVFNAPRALAEAALDAGYDGCSTASNHAFDQGTDGVLSTIEVMEAVGLAQSGMAASEAADLAPTVYDVNDISVAHISATYSLNGFAMPADRPYLVDLIEPADIIEEAGLAKAAGAEFVVVSLHWGNEYQHSPSSAQEQWLSEILPSDEVDLVIGHHAHVVQPIDKLGDEWVVFGLGNFLSNQSANCCVAASQDGMIATVTLLENDEGEIEAVGVEYVPTWVDRADGYVIRVALDSAPRDGRDLTDTLAVSAARTDEVVRSRLGETDGVTVGPWPPGSEQG